MSPFFFSLFLLESADLANEMIAPTPPFGRRLGEESPNTLLRAIVIAEKTLLTATERKLRESLVPTQEGAGSARWGNPSDGRNRDIQTSFDSFMEAKGETCGVR